MALGPEPDFRPPNLPPKKDQEASEATRSVLSSGSQPKAEKKRPYLPAPYLSPNTFDHLGGSEESRIHTELLPGSDIAPRFTTSGAGGGRPLLLPEDFLTRVQKESILLTVSSANLNSYCVAVHCNLLRGLGLSAEEADQIAVDHHLSNLSKADIALLDFAVKLGTRFSEFSREDAAKLRTLGFGQEQILESIVVTALNNFSNTLQMGLGMEPDFAPRRSLRKIK